MSVYLITGIRSVYSLCNICLLIVPKFHCIVTLFIWCHVLCCFFYDYAQLWSSTFHWVLFWYVYFSIDGHNKELNKQYLKSQRLYRHFLIPHTSFMYFYVYKSGLKTFYSQYFWIKDMCFLMVTNCIYIRTGNTTSYFTSCLVLQL